MDEDMKCKCGGCFCSPANAQLMEAAIARYSDRSSFANNTAQDNVNFNSVMFAANATNVLNQSNNSTLASDLAALAAINRPPAAAS